ncbi:MAG: glycyl-radical enzyme activating protein [Candidatus Delongbacteria bacterium]|nr:glycyl-radical enzyme activating protein [Candidatus Delongbacteria bacterium]
MKGTIFNIQRFSLHDGPGIRTTVFLKGCPLRCIWCHNPESFDKSIQVTFDKEKCLECLICKGVRDISTAEKCPANAIEVIGQDMSVDELFTEIYKDMDYFETSNGGVTFSGGEPLMQSEFLLEILKKCKENSIHTVIDTCGYAKIESFEKINEFVDLYLYDLKFIDNDIHKKHTSSSNESILANLKYLSEKNTRIFIRFPLIPGINDTEKNISEIIEFLNGINFEQINLLSYHGYEKNKYIKLGLHHKMDTRIKLSDERINEIKNIFVSAGFKTVVGG